MNTTKKLGLIMERFLGIIGGVGILIITANAFCRFVLKIPMSWSDEFLRTIMIYGYYIGAAVMFCEGGIMRLEILDGALRDKHIAYKILNIMLAAARHGDDYAREMLCRIYKVYFTIYIKRYYSFCHVKKSCFYFCFFCFFSFFFTFYHLF